MSRWKKYLSSGVLASLAACGSDLAASNASGDNPAADMGRLASADDGGVGNANASTLDSAVGRRGSFGADAAIVRSDSATDDASANDDGECGALLAHIRDFSSISHPDFEKFSGSGTKGLVQDTLGSDRKPVFRSSGSPTQITSADTFKQWYNDTLGININIPYTIAVTQGADGSYEFRALEFFPIDNQGFDAPPTNEPMLKGDDGKLHNFSFTTEVHTRFTYHGGEKFTFEGDDDLWIFVNGKLALDLGGLHSSLDGTIDFDSMASQLGISKGSTYAMDIFHAERHTVASHFTIRTTIDCFTDPFVL